jgi:hypothetical protein
MQRRPRVLRVALLISRVDKIQRHRPKTVGSHLKDFSWIKISSRKVQPVFKKLTGNSWKKMQLYTL